MSKVPNIDSELPEGWVFARLGEGLVVDMQPGFACGKNNREGEGIGHVRPMNVSREGRLALSDFKYVPASEADRDERLLRMGDVVFNNTNSPELVGKTAYYGHGEPLAFSNHMTRVRCRTDVLEPRYCADLLHHLWRTGYFEAICNNHVSQSSVGQDVLRKIEIPLAPLPEQKRILGALQPLLAQVELTCDILSRVPAILKRFRQAVLAAACSGKLTEDWRELNKVSEDATQQLEQMQVERREHFTATNGKRKYRQPDAVLLEDLPQIPKTWCWTNFDHCSWEITVGHVGPMRDRYVAKGISFLRCQNVRPLRFDPLGLVHIPPDFHAQLSKSKLSGGEILVVRSGANTGDCCVFPHNMAPANCSDLVITRPLSGLCAKYGAFYVSSPTGRARLSFNETGIAQPHFNIGAMRVKAFPLPPLVEQREIIGRVDALFKHADAIEELVAFASLRADKLTQSILAKAFRGELVPTEAELARHEGREYEPASVLLERIRTERTDRAKTSPVPKRKPRKATAHVGA